MADSVSDAKKTSMEEASFGCWAYQAYNWGNSSR